MICPFCDYEHELDDRYGCPNCNGLGLDQDIVRKACKLAGDALPPDCCSTRIGLEQWELDVLAAELVRQVDALPDVYFVSDDEYALCFADDFVNDRRQRLENRVDGPDRTMNTIRAIVESGVLETEK